MKRFKPGDPVKLKIQMQGKPHVNRCIMREFTSRVAVIDIDMVSKHCEVNAVWNCTSETGIFIDATDESLYLLNVAEESTIVEFPEFKDWEVVAKWNGGYTITLCLVKK